MRVHTLCFISDTRNVRTLAETVVGVYMSDTLANTAMREHFCALDGWNSSWHVDAVESAVMGKLYRAYNDDQDRVGYYSVRELILK